MKANYNTLQTLLIMAVQFEIKLRSSISDKSDDQTVIDHKVEQSHSVVVCHIIYGDDVFVLSQQRLQVISTLWTQLKYNVI